MRIAHISDLHITARPVATGLVRPDAVERATALIEDLSLFPGLDLVIITGDNVNDAQPAEYAVLSRILAGLRVPWLIVPGNHDDREMLRALAPDRAYADPDLMDHEWRRGHLRVMALDTLVPGQVAGRLGPRQLDWLEARLAQPFAGTTLVAMHHPPSAPGMGMLDGAILTEGAAGLQAILDAQPQPVTVLCGHMHRPFQAAFGRGRVMAAASTAFQFALDPGRRDEPPAASEPYSWDLHLIGADGSHVTHRRFPDL